MNSTHNVWVHVYENGVGRVAIPFGSDEDSFNKAVQFMIDVTIGKYASVYADATIRPWGLSSWSLEEN